METVNCMRCDFRHKDNGNCTAVGGFCTAVKAAHCPLLRAYLDTRLTPEQIKNLDSPITYIVSTGGDKPLKVIFANNSDQAFDIETKNESLILEGMRIIDVLSRKANGYESNNN